MTFDIHQMDRLSPDDSRAGQTLQDYQEGLLEDFSKSPEAQAYFGTYPDGGHWVAAFIEIGFHYLGKALPRMTADNVEEIVTELFPRKISLFSPDEADSTIPELLALWEYLKRERSLPQADSILAFLRKVEPEFKGLMFDPSRFGMAKSFVMMGQTAGFDMTSEADMNAFMTAYNASLAAGLGGHPGPARGVPGSLASHKADRATKKKRQQAKVARQRNRPKKT